MSDTPPITHPLHVWQPVCPGTDRMRVPSGWLYRTGVTSLALAYVPDPPMQIAASQQGQAQARSNWTDNQVGQTGSNQIGQQI